MINYESPTHVKDLVAELKMRSRELSDKNKHVVLVEGRTDIKIFSVIAGESNNAHAVELHIAGSRKNVIRGVQQISRCAGKHSKTPYGLVGIIDRDMEYREEIPARVAYVSDQHDDLESALVWLYGEIIMQSLISPSDQSRVMGDQLISNNFAGLRLQVCQPVTSLHVAIRDLHSTTKRKICEFQGEQFIRKIIQSGQIDRSNQPHFTFESFVDQFGLHQHFPEDVICEAAKIHSKHTGQNSGAATWKLCHGKYLVTCIVYYLHNYYGQALLDKRQTAKDATKETFDRLRNLCTSELFKDTGLRDKLLRIKELDGPLKTNYLGLIGN